MRANEISQISAFVAIAEERSFRKAAARLEELGYPVLYYENIDGGHAASANLAETARRQALEYVYLSRKLID